MILTYFLVSGHTISRLFSAYQVIIYKGREPKVQPQTATSAIQGYLLLHGPHLLRHQRRRQLRRRHPADSGARRFSRGCRRCSRGRCCCSRDSDGCRRGPPASGARRCAWLWGVPGSPISGVYSPVISPCIRVFTQVELSRDGERVDFIFVQPDALLCNQVPQNSTCKVAMPQS